MRNKSTKIWVTILLILLLGVVFAVSYRYYKTDQELIQVKSNLEDLEMDLHNESIKLETTKTDLKTVKKERDDFKTKYTADELYIQELEKRYFKLFSYAQIAEEILAANGIDFLMVEGGLDTESLTGENQ